MEKQNKSWSYSRSDRERDGYALLDGGVVIGHVRSRGDAEMICRAEREARRTAMLRAADLRQHRYRAKVLQDDIRYLMASLDRVARVLKRGSRPREVTAAREEVRKVLRKMRSRGHCA